MLTTADGWSWSSSLIPQLFLCLICVNALIGWLTWVLSPAEKKWPVPKPIGYIRLDEQSRSGKGRVDTIEEALAKLAARRAETMPKRQSERTMLGLVPILLANIDFLETCQEIVVDGSHAHLIFDFMDEHDIAWRHRTRWTLGPTLLDAKRRAAAAGAPVQQQ